jgi:alpha-glucosidase
MLVHEMISSSARRPSTFALSVVFAATCCATSAVAQATSDQVVTRTANGILISNHNGMGIRVEALRPDVLRVRMFNHDTASEDASWAVLQSARASKAPVTAEDRGFSTTALKVRIGVDLRVTISDLAGNVLQEDKLPVQWSTEGFKVTKAKSMDDHFFGLGDKTGPIDRVGQTFVMWNTDAWGAQESTDPIYKSIPFFLEMKGGRTIGVLFDNTYRTFFDFGREDEHQYTFTAPAGPLDYYVLYGPEPKHVVETYAWLTGPTPLPPMWALGFQQSRYSYETRAQLEEVTDRLRADKIPSDAIYMDIDYQVKNRPFTVDEIKFPDLSGMIHKLAEEHFHTVMITDLHIADVPNAGYAPYDSGEAGDHFVKENGKDYVGPVWPGPSVFPDFTQAQTRQWWGTLYKEFVVDGAAGFWNDMNEPAVFRYPSKTMPDDVEHRIDEPASLGEGFSKRTATHLEIHNVYGMENSRATMDGLLTLRPNERPFVLTRASYAGGQRYAATWTGDNLATWASFRMTTPQLLNLGLSGFAFSGADPGYGGSPSPELLTKWTMVAAFQPLDRNHSSAGTRRHEVWVDGPMHEAIRRRYIEERYKLMPYLYTTAEEMSRDGLPIDRPLFLEFPHAATDNHPLDDDAAGEFMFGPSILVAGSPLPDDIAAYEVHLPPVIWYDYWSGAKLDRRAPVGTHDLEIRDPITHDPKALPNVMVEPRLDELPIYVRGGAIVPMQPLVQSTEETPVGPLTLRVFLPGSGEPCSGDVYADDGKSFDFRKGAYLRLHVTCQPSEDGTSVRVTIAPREGSFSPWWKAYRIELVGFSVKDPKISLPDMLMPLEKTTLGWAATIPDTGGAQSLTFH